MHDRSLKPILIVIVLSVLVAGCAMLARQPEPPTVTLAGIQLLELSLLEQRYRLQLRIHNPNDFALPIAGMAYRVTLNGTEFARGVSARAVSVPAFGEAVLDVEGTSNLSNVLRQLQLLGSLDEQTLTYSLTGNVKLRNRAARIPFRYDGKIDLDATGPPARRSPSEPSVI